MDESVSKKIIGVVGGKPSGSHRPTKTVTVVIGQTCIVKGCKKDSKTRSYHMLPKDPATRQKWLWLCNRTEEDLKTLRMPLVCSQHFYEADFYHKKFGHPITLRPSAIPTVFPQAGIPHPDDLDGDGMVRTRKSKEQFHSPCIVPGCSLSDRKRAVGLTYHSMVKNPEIRRKWFEACHVEDKAWNKKKLFVCGLHFLPTDYSGYLMNKLLGIKTKKSLMVTAVPSVFPWTTPSSIPSEMDSSDLDLEAEMSNLRPVPKSCKGDSTQLSDDDISELLGLKRKSTPAVTSVSSTTQASSSSQKELLGKRLKCSSSPSAPASSKDKLKRPAKRAKVNDGGKSQITTSSSSESYCTRTSEGENNNKSEANENSDPLEIDLPHPASGNPFAFKHFKVKNMFSSCAIEGCVRTLEDISYHVVPKNKEMRKKWIEVC